MPLRPKGHPSLQTYSMTISFIPLQVAWQAASWMQTHRFPNFPFSYPAGQQGQLTLAENLMWWKLCNLLQGPANPPILLRPTVWSQASPRFGGRPLWLLSNSAGQINYCAHTLSARTTSLAAALHAWRFTLRKCLSCIGDRTQERDIKPWIAIGVHILFNIVFSNVWGSPRDTGGPLLQMAYV